MADLEMSLDPGEPDETFSTLRYRAHRGHEAYVVEVSRADLAETVAAGIPASRDKIQAGARRKLAAGEACGVYQPYSKMFDRWLIVLTACDLTTV